MNSQMTINTLLKAFDIVIFLVLIISFNMDLDLSRYESEFTRGALILLQCEWPFI